MPIRFLIFLIGFGFTVIGSTYIILYLNLFTIGYNFIEYVNYIIRRFECLIFIIGILLIILSIFFKGGKNELYLWYYIKFK